MKNKGKTIKLFLIDGQPNGRIQCELSNWTGKAYRIPRNQVRLCDDRADLDNAGVYLLLGRQDNGDPCAYIGEADGIRERMRQHLQHKEFWNEVIIFISKDNNLNKAHVRYLEKRLYEIAKQVDRYVLMNSNTPGGASISEPDAAEMEEFIDNLKVVINTLGVKIFEPIREQHATLAEEQANTFHLQTTNGASATGQRNSDGFVVLKGSVIRQATTPSYQNFLLRLREKLIADGVIEDFKFTKDYLFSSPSTAASIVMGRNANGLLEWKLPTGKCLKEIE